MDKQLLFSLIKKDFRVDTFRSGGKGGQYQNTCDSGVRITHIESGAVGESRDERSQHTNKKKAFERLIASNKFQIWMKRKSWEAMGIVKSKEQIEKEVDEMINRDIKNGNIIVEEV